MKAFIKSIEELNKISIELLYYKYNTFVLLQNKN